MQYNIINRSEKIFLKDILRIPKDDLDKIFNKLNLLGNYGLENAQIKKINNYRLCDYRVRVGNFRILFNINEINKEIIIFRILHRSKLY